MLYELIFGRNPFNLEEEDYSAKEFKEIVFENELLFPDKDQFDIEYSDDLMDLIKCLLNKNSAKRISFEQVK